MDQKHPKADSYFRNIIHTRRVFSHHFKDDGSIPNNKLPLLLYPGVIMFEENDSVTVCKSLFSNNQWNDSWTNGIYSFHHFHSNAHEVLGVCDGTATVQFGGKKGIISSISRGDVVVIPAGVGHKNLRSSPNLLVVGAYPPNQRNWDLCKGNSNEYQQALQNIPRVSLPTTDPVYGKDGPLTQRWI